MSQRHDPDGRRLPVKLDATTNGEFAPVPLAPVHHQANRLAHEAATVNARRLGLGRRGFLVSACGVASSLLGNERGLCARLAAAAAGTTCPTTRRSISKSHRRAWTATSSSSTSRAIS